MSKEQVEPKNSILILRVVKSNFFMPQTEWSLEPGEYVLGRYPTNDIVIPDPYVSRRHARIFYENGEWYIEDLDSTNGTIVDNEDIRGKGPKKINNNSEIVVGLTILSATIEEKPQE
ncbi:FHA domain containing protein [Staphylothermus marinus F1]|uniref:FHA domain containing protein n=1 Tax=Staphylothermus marinus (strain ATCC 43588 / DSM 3639 / JCM 9404 / F1) TaxID=399550 RepID=A3DLZ2_STAMF|nr:FHA domain-containing protein [Staphylothermus marinus]ABN69652.1 FHA domain containing protein [Staphylothermus marinus F1]